jgi:predicted Zn-dependent peptidase
MSNIKYITLPNKLNIVLINDNKTDLVMTTVNVAVGSNMETPNISGIAHIAEHILFHNKHKKHDITKEIHEISAHFNAATSYDQTNYYLISNKSDSCKCIDMLYNIYVNNTFTDEDLIKEKKIVLEEYGLTYSNVNRLLVNELFRNLFGKAVSENLFVIGSIDSINNTTKQDIIKYKKQYVPELTTIIMVGNFDEECVLNTMKKSFGTVPNNKTISDAVLNTTVKLIPKTGFFKYISLRDQSSTQCLILFAFKSFTYKDNNKYSADMISYMLNYFILFEKLRLDNGNTYSSRSSILNNNDFGLLALETQVDFKYLLPVLQTIADILKDLKTNPVKQNLLDRTIKKLNITTDLMYQDFREYHKWFNQQAIASHDFSSFITPTQYVQKCSSITPGMIQTTANKLFDPKHSYLLVLGPQFDKAKVIAEIFSKY